LKLARAGVPGEVDLDEPRVAAAAGAGDARRLAAAGLGPLADLVVVGGRL
jgi:hypothetical protein